MTKDKVTPANTQSEYKSMILSLVSKNEELMKYATNELTKGFKFTANEILARVESNLTTIDYYEQMLQVLTIGESEQYYTGNRYN